MLRPDKKYSVYDQRQLKGKRCLTHVHPWMIEAMAREGIPVVGHLGMVPRHATWTNVRAIGKTPAEARKLYDQMKRLENAGAYAAELELVPHKLASYFCKKTSLLLMSLGSGSG